MSRTYGIDRVNILADTLIREETVQCNCFFVVQCSTTYG